MRAVQRLRIVLGIVLVAGTRWVLAGVPVATSETVVIESPAEEASKCAQATPALARLLADKAAKERAYQRAGECYLAAGEQALADQAFVRAAAQSSPQTNRRLASNLDEVKAQARQVKSAFRHQQ